MPYSRPSTVTGQAVCAKCGRPYQCVRHLCVQLVVASWSCQTTEAYYPHRLERAGLGLDVFALPSTVTLPSCEWADLGSSIDSITDSLRQMSRRKPFAWALGSLHATEFTVNSRTGLVHNHRHSAWLFGSMEEADYARERLPHLWQKATGVSVPNVHTADPYPASDMGRLKGWVGYCLKPVDTNMMASVLAGGRYATLFEAVNGRRPGHTRSQLVSTCGVLSARYKPQAIQTAWDSAPVPAWVN